MQVSLRSQMAAGAVAVVGTSVIALTPIVQTGAELPTLPAARSMAVALVDNPVANPFFNILTGLNLVNTDLFDGVDTYPVFGGMYKGIIPEFIYNAMPIGSQLGYNWSYYIGQAVAKILTNQDSTASSLTNYIWDAAPAVVTAAQQAFSGNFDEAINTLYTALIAPIPGIVTPAVDAIKTVVHGVVSNALNVIGALPGIAADFVNTSVAVLQALTAEALDVTTEVISKLASFDVIGAWNAYWEKGWGAGGFPGMLEQATLGGGLNPQDWPGVVTDYIPSFRVWAQGADFSIANALGAAFPTAETATPAAAVAPHAAAARVAAAAAAANESAQAEDSNGSASSGDSIAGAPSGSESTGGAASDNSTGGSKPGAKVGHRSGGASADSGGGTGHGKAHGAARRAS